MKTSVYYRAMWLALVAILFGAWSCGAGDHGSAPVAGDADASTTASSAAPPALMAAAHAAIARDALAFTEHAGAWTAVNAGQGFSASIDGSGATLAKLDAAAGARPGWTLGLHVARVGRAGAMQEVTTGAPSAADARVTIARGGPAGLTEWFEHGARGLEHGTDIASRPAGDGELVIEVAIAGLTPVLADGGARVELLGAAGDKVLTYGQLAVQDAGGRPVAARMTVVGGAIAIVVQDAGANYPLAVDPLMWGVQQAELLASDGATGDSFGMSVSISGTTAIVGTMYEPVGTYHGAAYVFVQSGSTWMQQQKLVASDAAANDHFGYSVAISGTTAIIGARDKNIGSNMYQGAAYVFVQSGSTWTQQQELLASDGAANDEFGASVSISGATAIVGTYQKTVGSNAAQGATYVFVRSGSTWTQQQELVASDGAANDEFGLSISISGTTAIVGASRKTVGSNAGQGAAYVFVQSGSTWTQQQELVASDGAANGAFGESVSVSGTTAIVSAPGFNASQGAAYVFVQSGSTWTQQQKLIASDGATGDVFGASVSISGTGAIVGAYQKTVASNTLEGAAYVFVQSGSTWTQQAEPVASNGAMGDAFGVSVAISGTTAIVGAWGKTVGSNVGQGAAYVFVEAHAGGDACASPLDCVSGFCVHSVCCDSACPGGSCMGGTCVMASDAGATDGGAGDSGTAANDSGAATNDSGAAAKDSGLDGPGGDAASDASGGGAPSGQNSGCGCRTAERQDGASYALLWLGAVGMVGTRRLRRRSRPGTR